MTILFLDFDGVLHPDAAFLQKGRLVLRAEGELFMWAPYLVEALVPYPVLKIVLPTLGARTWIQPNTHRDLWHRALAGDR